MTGTEAGRYRVEVWGVWTRPTTMRDCIYAIVYLGTAMVTGWQELAASIEAPPIS